MNTLLSVPGLPPMPSSDVVRTVLDRTTYEYEKFLEFSVNIPNSAGILVNTFESLEPKPLKAMREGKCNSDGNIPPIFCVGPLLVAPDKMEVRHECLNWLDKQPSKSVVYIRFGSGGKLSMAQLKELADGLERSGQRFLWVVRPPPEEKVNTEPDFETILPTGFLDRTEGRGMVVKNWAPQVAVLNHEAVGGFLTHCGWNSILEALCAGVAMATWPLYAEQRFNRVFMVDDLGLALRVEQAADGFVTAEEVEKKVKELMGESRKVEEVRKEVEKKSGEAKAAMAEGGASIAALGKPLQVWKSA